MKISFTFFIVCCFIVLSSNAVSAQANNSEDSLSYDKKLFNVVNHNYSTVESFKNNVQNLINQGADPNGVVKYRYTFKRFGARIPIIQAFYTEKYREALIITTPFHWAVSIGNKEKTQVLLDQGGNVNSHIDGKYPINIAIKNNDTGMIDLLIKNGSKIEGVDIAELRDLKMIDFLIEKGADSTRVNFNLAFSNYDLLKRYISYNPTFKDVRIDYRYIFDNNELFNFLMENGMPTSVVGTDIGKCKLIIGATQYQNEYALKKIIEKGGNVNEKCTNSFDVTPLTNAIKNENIAIVKLLLASGVDPNQTTFMKKSSLSVAIDTENQDIIELIVEAGVDINSALIKSVKDDNEVLASYFIEKGANPHVDAGFNSPIRKAKSYNIPEIVAYLEGLD